VGQAVPAMIRLWRKAWSEFIPFLDYDVEIRKVICWTNSIESLKARYRRAVKARRHSLPDRTGRIEVSVSGHPIPGPGGRLFARVGERLFVVVADAPVISLVYLVLRELVALATDTGKDIDGSASRRLHQESLRHSQP